MLRSMPIIGGGEAQGKHGFQEPPYGSFFKTGLMRESGRVLSPGLGRFGRLWFLVCFLAL